MIDRYTKIVLTVIAGALVYLCVVMTAFPAVQAQGTRKAGEMITTPIEAVIVGWKLTEPLQIATTRPAAGPDRAQRPAPPIASSSSAGKRTPHANGATHDGPDSVVEWPEACQCTPSRDSRSRRAGPTRAMGTEIAPPRSRG